MLWTGNASQAVFTKIVQADTLGKAVKHQAHSDVREHDLSSVCDAQESSNTVHWPTEIVAVALFGYTGVQSHAHAQRLNFTPILISQGALGGQGGIKGGLGYSECSAKGIPYSFEDEAPMPFDDLSHKGMVLGDDFHHVGMVFPEPRTSYNITEHKGDGTSRRGRRLSLSLRCS